MNLRRERDLELESKQTQCFDDEFGVNVELFREYCRLMRAMLLRKKAMKFDEITKQIQVTRDRSKIVKLVGERDALKYNPLEPPKGMLSSEDIQSRGQEFVDQISEREIKLLIQGEEEMSDDCINYQKKILSYSREIGIELESHDSSSNSISSRISFVCQSTSIILNEKRSRELEGIYFGSFSIGSLLQNVTIKVNRSGRDISHEYETLCRLNRNQLNSTSDSSSSSGNKFLHALSLESITSTESSSCPIQYLVLEDFGSDLRVVMRRDNLKTRKTIFVPLLLEAVSDLHKMGVMHGDLKPQNILIKDVSNGGGNYQMKICDFDCSRFINPQSPAPPIARDEKGRIKFSASWVSPEVFSASNCAGDVLSSFAIDLFSLGLLIEVLSRPECDPSTTALPSPDFDFNYHELRVLFGDQENLYGIMESLKGSYSQTSIVRELLRLEPSERGTAEAMLELFRSMQGTKGFRKIVELNKLISDLQSIKALTRSELEGSLGDLMSYLSSSLNLHQSEIIDILKSRS